MTPLLSRRALIGAAATATMLPRLVRAAPVGLRVGDQKGGVRSVMKAAGALDALPYPVEWSQFPAANPVLEALNAGAIDLAYAGDAPTTFALSAGLQGRIIAVTRSSGHGTAIVVPKASPITDAAGLKGHSIAANRGSIAHALVLALMEQQGWAPGAVTVANLFPAEAKAALTAGAVESWASWGVYIAQAKLADGDRVVADGSGGLLTNLSYVVASDPAIASRRDILLDFSRRLAAARRWALQHPELYAPVLAADIGVSTEIARSTFDTDQPTPVAVDAGVVADEQRTADLYLRAKVIHSRLDASTAFDPSFNAALG